MKWIGKSQKGDVFLCSKTEVTDDYNQAEKYDHIGDAMKACIKFNNHLGYAVFKVERIYN